jgi:hypothetical protein
MNKTIKKCLCGCGSTVNNKWKVGHWIKMNNPTNSLHVRKLISDRMKADNPYFDNSELKEKKSKEIKEWWANNPKAKISKDNLIKGNIKRNKTKKHREIVSDNLKRKWKTKEYQDMMQKKLHIKPNISELKLLTILSKYGYKYSGDFTFFIDGKNPDFIHLEDKSIVELFGEWVHPITDEMERTKFFNDRGWKVLIIWYNELRDMDAVIDKIKKYTSNNEKK